MMSSDIQAEHQVVRHLWTIILQRCNIYMLDGDYKDGPWISGSVFCELHAQNRMLCPLRFNYDVEF